MYAKKRHIAIGLLGLLLTAPASAASLNKDISVAAGATSDGASSVNGSVTVGAAAIVSGSVDSVNGTIRIDDDARVEDVETVNGSIKIGDRVQSEGVSTVNGSIKIGREGIVDGELSTVNGGVFVDTGTRVARDASTVNGSIRLKGSEVGGDITTVNGDVKLEDQSVLRGDLTIEEPSGNYNKKKKPKITIGPGSRVEGSIIVERAVDLYISNTAEVGGVSGVMSMDDAVRFDGSRP